MYGVNFGALGRKEGFRSTLVTQGLKASHANRTVIRGWLGGGLCVH